MKLGYTIKGQKEREQLIQAGCHEVLSQVSYLSELESFEQFVLVHKDRPLVVVDLASIGKKLTLLDLWPVLTMIKQEQLDVTFLQIQEELKLSSQDYLQLLCQIVHHDKAAMRLRTLEGMARSKKEGIKTGRPAITPDLIRKINYLRQIKGYTIREIARRCRVSTGTAYKYAQANQWEDVR